MEVAKRSIALVFSSGGGKPPKGGTIPRNADYAEGLKLILRRLAQLDATITDAYVDSSKVQKLPLAERRLDIRGCSYPIRLSELTDFDALRKRLTGAQKLIGKRDKTKGGNERKRIRILLKAPGFPVNSESADRLGLILSEPAALPPNGDTSEQLPDKGRTSGSGRGGQGFNTDVATKLVVEDAAMKAARKHYTDRKWHVTDVSAKKIGYDLLCVRGGERLCVEVKGTTQSPKSVLVSPNEVSFALANPQRSVLFVWSDIVISTEKDGTPIASGGVPMVLQPWKIEIDRLSAVGYNYALDGLVNHLDLLE